MIEKQMSFLTPTKLRVILCVSIIIILIASALGFWLFRNQMIAYANSVKEDARTAAASSSDIAMLQNLKTQLEENSVAVTRAKSIVADSQAYQYQDQIINDINRYAKAAGVTVAGYSFSANDATTGAAAAPSAAGAPAATDPAAAAAPSGLKTTSVSITLGDSISYRSIIRFIHSIELNLTKMQLSGITLAQSDNDDTVTVGPLTVEVYIR